MRAPTSPARSAQGPPAEPVVTQRFELFVAGAGESALRARANVEALLDSSAGHGHELAVIDVLVHPESAERSAIIATPTLIRRAPLPECRLTGDFSDAHAAARALWPQNAPASLPAPDELFTELLYSGPDGMLVLDAGGRIVFVNRAAEALLGRDAAALLGQPFGAPLAVGHRNEIDLPGPHGVRTAELTALHVPWEGEPATLAILRDITDVTRAARELHESQERFRAAFADAGVAMAVVAVGGPDDGRLEQVNAAMVALTGRDEAALLRMTMDELTHADDRPAARDDLARLVAGDVPSLAGEQRILDGRGEAVWVQCTGSLVGQTGSGATQRIVHLQDLSEQKDVEQRLRQLADHDALTGLFNRRSFERELARELASAARYQTGGALLLIDLDHFKDVDDTLGHPAGDKLLAHVARCLEHRVRETDIIARLGGDEFAVILPHTDATTARTVAADIVATLKRKPSIATSTWGQATSASIGVALFADAGTMTADDLLKHADLAMYEAKHAGRGRVAVFDPDDQATDKPRSRASWPARIRYALDDERFVLHRQPIVAVGALVPVQDELLLRIVEDDGALTPAAEFIEAAERLDLAMEIDRWVVDHAIESLSNARASQPDLSFAINLSARSLGDEELIDHIRAGLAGTNLDPGALTFELTETAAIADMDAARRFATRLRALGCKLALDDFDAGHASYAYLKHLDFDCIKIDGGFITDLDRDLTSQLLVTAIVDIARGLGTQTTAEHVEHLDTLRYLRDAGVTNAQGFAIAVPTVTGSSGRDLVAWHHALAGP